MGAHHSFARSNSNGKNRFALYPCKFLTSAEQRNRLLFTSTAIIPDANEHLNPVPTHPIPSNCLKRLASKTSNPNHSGHHTHDIYKEVVACNRLISQYVKAGDLECARRVFDSMTVKTTVTWNSLLAGYVKKPGKLKDACQLFDRIPEPDIFSYNTMLACYVRKSDVATARKFFDQMPIRDTASWNTMVAGFAENGRMEEAKSLFTMMPTRNDVSWNTMISGYAECGDMESALELFKEAPARSDIAWTTIINGFMKYGKVGMAESFYEAMPVKSLITMNCMINGYVENNRAEDGLKLFKWILSSGIKPNPSTLTSVLLGCSVMSALVLGRQIHQLMYKSPLYLHTTVGTSLLSMYCKCGALEDAKKLFTDMPRKDLVTWNSMISGYAHHGHGEKALYLFDKLKNENNIQPDGITFVAVLTACNHAGLVDLGTHYFNTMKTDYGVEAKPEHYTCIVDSLGRAGKLVEAVRVIEKMPYKPHVAVLGALLGACRIHKNLELAEFAAKNLLTLDPTNAACYIQLANIYGAMSNWHHVAWVYKQMRVNKLVKIPGCSWIEIDNVVHEFRSSDTIHPELSSIHEKLAELVKKIKLAGYVPDLRFALHDVREELREQLLLWHSEKLAIAFGLMRVPTGLPIRVFKNLRFCGDCHQAAKFISLVEAREIIVRDGRRFHHFRDGSCSCGDYW